jgi:hypothetical protein
MPSIADIRFYLTILQIVGYVLLLRKLLRTHLLTKYRYFSLLIGAEAIRLIVMTSLPPRSNLYAEVYFATSPIIWILLALVVLEFFQLILKNHIGIATIGKKAVTWALIISTAVTGSTLLFDLQRNGTEPELLFTFMLLERMVTTSLLVLLLCLIGFASHFPVPVTRNIRVHASIFAVYFSLRTALFVLRLVFGVNMVPVMNTALQMLGVACIIAWIVLLTPAGEDLPLRRAPSASEERLLAQLEAINESLMRTSRK